MKGQLLTPRKPTQLWLSCAYSPELGAIPRPKVRVGARPRGFAAPGFAAAPPPAACSLTARKLDLFFEAEIQITRSRKSDLHTLTEISLRNPFAGIRENIRRTQTASYFVELIELCTESDHHEPELFSLLRRAFNYLNETDPTLRAMFHFETELARIGGVHDARSGESDAALALANLFGRLPRSREELKKILTANVH